MDEVREVWNLLGEQEKYNLSIIIEWTKNSWRLARRRSQLPEHNGMKVILVSIFEFQAIQLNEYETAPDFLQLSQNMTSDCLFTFVFFPVLTWIYLFCAKNCFVLMFRTIFGAKQVNSGKNGEKHKSKQTISCHILA